MAKETKWETSEKKKKVKVEDKIQRITTREVKVDEKVRVFLIIIERGKRLRLSVNVNQFHVVALSFKINSIGDDDKALPSSSKSPNVKTIKTYLLRMILNISIVQYLFCPILEKLTHPRCFLILLLEV